MTAYDSSYFEAFKKTYIQRSANPEWFELICFERYFVLLEFMRQKEYKECFMIDSDVLLYGEVSSLDRNHFDAGGGLEKIFVNPCILYWNISALEDFVLFCLTQYQNQEKWPILEKRYLDIKRKNPWCTDTSDRTYKMTRKLHIKKYRLKDGLPFIVNSGHKIDQVFAVHCQGSAKKYIDLLYRRKPSLLAYYLLTFRKP